MFERTCILGYPPFVKGVIDAGLAQAVPWQRYNLCMVLAGEVFTEEWRRLVAERAGISAPCRDIVSIYGTADAGVLGNETPLSAVIRDWLAGHPEWARDLFGSDRLPSLMQYDPAVRLIEVTAEGTLVLTCLDAAPQAPGDQLRGAPPMVRYHIQDKGGTIDMRSILAFAQARGFSPLEDPRLAGIPTRGMPFCWVFGRAHWAVSLFGANVFVDQVMVGLERPDVAAVVTGKFILSVKHESDSDPVVHLDVELSPNTLADQASRTAVAQSVKESLVRLSSEYAHYVPPERQLPSVALWPHGEPTRFPVGVKHRYTL